MDDGRTVARTPHFALHRFALEASPTAPGSAGSVSDGSSPNAAPGPAVLFAVRGPWLGALVPKRWARRAVTRNAIKRQIYTVAQDLEHQLPTAAHVVRLRAAFDRREFVSATSDALKRAVRAELTQLLAGVRP